MTLQAPPRTRRRNSDPATSHAGARDVRFREGSQKARLMLAYADRDMTAWEAAHRAGLDQVGTCYWKRVSELVHQHKLLEPTGEQRPGGYGSDCNVYRVSRDGWAYLIDRS